MMTRNNTTAKVLNGLRYTGFRTFFTPTHLEAEDSRNQGRLLRVILWVAISCSLLSAMAVVIFDHEPAESLIDISILLAVELGLLWLTHRHRVRLASFLMTFSLGLILLFFTYAYGGIDLVTYSSFVIVILSGGLLLGKRYIWITLLLGILGGLFILILQTNQELPNVELPDLSITWISTVFTFTWAGAILYMAMQNMEAALRRAQAEIQARKVAYDTTLAGWSRALELRDHETEGHSERVVEAAVKLAEALGMRGEALDHLRRGAFLHDIGKMGIPDAILGKPGPLNEEEWQTMRQHPVLAYYLLNPIDFLRPALDIPYYHHERWDGGGYPRGLKGEEIPLAARLFAVVDVWDALLSNRPYRQGWPQERVMAYLREQAGKQFDPHIVDVFLAQNMG